MTAAELRARGLKRCTGCRQVKPIAEAFRRYTKRGRSYPRPRCRDCERAAWAAARPADPARAEAAARAARGLKRCTRCGLTKPIESSFRTQAKAGRVYPRSWCRACERIAKQLRREEDPGHEAAARAARRARPEVAEACRAAARRYYRRNRDRILAEKRTVPGRLRQELSDARTKLARATSWRRRAALEGRIRAIEAELARMQLAPPRRRGRPEL